MRQPLVSIVTATFNIEAFVEKAVLSVLNQTYPNIEYLVVDGGSTDKTLEILKKYGSRINLVSEKDNGLYDALNKGFKMAKGEILTWLDADNFYLSNNVIEKIAQEFSQDESLDLVVANTEARFSDNWKSVFNFPPKNLSFDLLLNQGNKLVPEGVFFKKTLFEKSGGLDIQYKLLADYELWLKMFKLKPKFKKIEMASAVFSVRNDALLRKDPFLAWRETYLIGTKYGWSWLKRFHFFLRYFIERLRFFLAPAWRKIISKK
jgi:glycosyltransferase involved in cell wall biosynthesis